MINSRSILIVVLGLLLTAIGTGRLPAEARPAPGPALTDHFVQTAQIVAGDGRANERFGSAVAIDGDTLVVNSNYGSYPVEPNAVYVFVRDGSAWTFQAKLTASDGTPNDQFGIAVAIDGNTILVGAYLADIEGNEDQGAAYVFTRSGETWTEQARLTASDGIADGFFGWSVALWGDTALVGVNPWGVGAQYIDRQGAAYVFTRSGDTWTEQERLSVDDGELEYFGYAVALHGTTAVVGAGGGGTAGGLVRGAAYVFTYNGAAWSEQARLTASDGGVDAFGGALDFDGSTLIVGAPFFTIDGVFGRGAVYIYTGSGAAWTEQAKLMASDYENNREFGYAVAVQGDTALVAAMIGNVDGNVNQGAAYVFTLSESGWSEQAKLTHNGGAEHDFFGDDVALDAGTALIGAPRVDVNGNEDQGAAYVFERWEGAFSLYLPAVSGG